MFSLAGGEGFGRDLMKEAVVSHTYIPLLQFRAATGKGNYSKLLSSSQASFTKMVVSSLLAVFLSMVDNRYNF